VTPFPVILSSPSGGGKTTIARRLLEERDDVGYSVSATTRPRRADEVDGVDYHFLTPDAFRARQAAGDFAEWALVHGNLYGTLRSEVERVLGSGRHVLMDIDIQGARQFRGAFPQSVLVFLIPPSVEVLVGRLRARGTETEGSIRERLRNAVEEVEAARSYDYVVVNDDLSAATNRVSAIINAEGTRVGRDRGSNDRIAALLDALLDELRRSIPVNE
jgi:guanylate kinase